MFIAVMGVNHRSAPVNIRERMSFSENRIKNAFPELLVQPGVLGCCILSTCNRTEIYVTSDAWEMGRQAVRAFWVKSSGLEYAEISRHIFCLTQEEAVSHLFRVTSGLDSMVLGETEILGQVKRAYMLAHEAGATDAALNTLFQQALSTAKRARSETGIDRNPVSVPSVAVELIKRKLCEPGFRSRDFCSRQCPPEVQCGETPCSRGLCPHKDSSLIGRSVLVIGAGKMSELTLVHLKANGISGIVVSNRSYDKALELARTLGGRAVRFDAVREALAQADIVISGTAAQHIVLSAETVAQAMARRPERPLLLVDIAVPRDIDPEVSRLAGVTLFDVDNLQQVVDRSSQERRHAACLGEEIVREDCGVFMERLTMSSVNPVIRSLQNFGEEVREQELKRALSRLHNLSPKERTAVETMATSIMNKIILRPLQTLRQAALSSQGPYYMQLTQEMFGLGDAGPGDVRVEPEEGIKGTTGLAEVAGTVKDRCQLQPSITVVK